MPLAPNAVERLAILRLQQGPGPLLDVFSGLGFRMVVAGVRLGVFDTLASGPRTAEAVARDVGADPDATRLLLDALEALGYLRRSGDRYKNAPMARKWMVRGRAANVVGAFDFWGDALFTLWDDLEDTLAKGEPARPFYDWLEDNPKAADAFQAWMVSVANFAGDAIARKVRIPRGARRLLDVGGGHGLYSEALCRRHEGLEATVLDTPQALHAAERHLAASPVRDRVRLRAGDFREDDLGEGHDAILLFNILHGFPPDENVALLRRAAGALRPGGRVFILDELAGGEPIPTSRAANRMMGVIFCHMLGGRTYAYPEVKGWLADAGFRRIRRKRLLKPPGVSLVTATHR